MKNLILFAALLALPAFAADKAAGAKGKHPELTKEQREMMAKSHEKMAECLRSDKPMEDCMHEMMKSCEDMGDMCPMHGHKKGMRMGKHHGHDHEKDSDDKKE